MSSLLQPEHLRNHQVLLRPLRPEDREGLYLVAADPLIWEQHPNPDRYQRPVFDNYFNGALESGGALLIIDAINPEIVGCTRYYDYHPDQQELKIGYTFFARSCWGKSYNTSTKKLMLDHAFTFADTVLFHVGANNFRSRRAMEKLGARAQGEIEVAYYGEAVRTNVEFKITRELWEQNQTKG